MDTATDDFRFLPARSAVAELIRAFDWEATGVGPARSWPLLLKHLLGAMLRSRQPMLLWWGPGLVQFHNDAYVARGGTRHPFALGRRGAECWADVWHIVGRQVDEVMQQGLSSWHEDQLIPLGDGSGTRDGYYTYSLSPAVDEAGEVHGTLVSFVETSARVVTDRRRMILQNLMDCLAGMGQGARPSAVAVEVFEHFPHDLPWVGMYRLNGPGTGPEQVDATPGPSPDTALRRRLADDSTGLATVRAGGLFRLDGLAATACPDRQVLDCLLVPIRGGEEAPVQHFVAYALNPRLAFDAAHRQFLKDLTDRLALALLRRRADELRQKTERERNDLLNHAPIATAILVGRELLFTLANPMYLQVVGRTEVVGRTYEEAFPELVDTPLPGILRRAYDTGEAYVSPEMLIMLDRSQGRAPPETTYFQFSLQPLRDDSQKVYALAAVCVDLTFQVVTRQAEQRRHEAEQARLEGQHQLLRDTIVERTEDLRSANEALLRANQELAVERDRADAANRQKSAFLANMSHEIRTPLNAIIGLSHLMSRASTDAFQLSRLEKVSEAGHHLLQVINDILDLSKIEAGALVLDLQVFMLPDLVARAKGMVFERAREKNLALEVDLSGMPVALLGDPTRLSQVLINLLSNAVKFTEQGSVRLVGREVETEGERSLLRFEVRDTGPGIPCDQQKLLFNAFVQADDSPSRQHGGTGLGLALCRQLSRAMGGETGVESEPGVGSTFWFTAWLKRAGVQELAALSAEVPASDLPLEEQLRDTHGGRRVLLAEDNAVNREVAVALLESAGLRVDTAVNGAEATRLAAEHRYVVILMDVQMPVLDGVEAARRIRAAGGHQCPIVAMTANAFVEDRDACLAAGMNDHLTKPVKPEQLYTVLLRWMALA